MLMVGTVSVNRVRADCLDFGDIRTVSASKGAVKRQQKAMDQRARD
ncbi:spore germination cell wall hydrolase CwlJ-like protein [Lysinibacillus sp. TE18511]